MPDITNIEESALCSTVSKEMIKRINDRLPELRRAGDLIGHSTSQTSYSLQTMQMISDSPLSRMKQCLAQIEKKYRALQEAYFTIEEKKLKVQKLSKNTDSDSVLETNKLNSEIESTTLLMNHALRQIGMFQNMYDSIRKNNNIPEDWNEKDYEAQEIDNMIRSCMRIGIQDLSAQGRVSKAFVEYCEQLGIHPQLAESRIRKYLTSTQIKINEDDYVSINEMYTFLDEMVNEFKETYKLALTRMGLDELGSEEFMAKGVTKPR